MSSNRIFHPDFLHLVTSRTLLGMFTLTPTREVKQIIASWFARTKNEHAPNMEIYAFIFLSNHFHMLVRDPFGELPTFMREFKGKCARELNRHYERRGVPVWPQKYNDTLIADNESVTVELAYLLCNPVKHGLVREAATWSGVSSLPCHLKGKPFVSKVFFRTEYEAARRHGRKVKRDDFTEEYEVALSTPPMWKNLSAKSLMEKFQQLVESGSANYRRRWKRPHPVGMTKILKQSPFAVPNENRGAVIPKGEPAADDRFRCKDEERLKQLKAWFYDLMRRYREVFQKFAANAVQVIGKKKSVAFEWPPGTYPPSSIRPVPLA
jgi:putative transposase